MADQTICLRDGGKSKFFVVFTAQISDLTQFSQSRVIQFQLLSNRDGIRTNDAANISKLACPRPAVSGIL